MLYLWDSIAHLLQIAASTDCPELVSTGLYSVVAILAGLADLADQRRQALPFIGSDKAKTTLVELALEGTLDNLPKPHHSKL